MEPMRLVIEGSEYQFVEGRWTGPPGDVLDTLTSRFGVEMIDPAPSCVVAPWGRQCVIAAAEFYGVVPTIPARPPSDPGTIH